MQNQVFLCGHKSANPKSNNRLWKAWGSFEKKYERTTENLPKICIENCSEKWTENRLIQSSVYLRPKNCAQISPVFRQLLRLHVWVLLEHSDRPTSWSTPRPDPLVQPNQTLELVGQAVLLHHVSNKCQLLLALTVGFVRQFARRTEQWRHASGSKSFDSTAGFAMHRINTAPEPPKTNKTRIFGGKITINHPKKVGVLDWMSL